MRLVIWLIAEQIYIDWSGFNLSFRGRLVVGYNDSNDCQFFKGLTVILKSKNHRFNTPPFIPAQSQARWVVR